MMSLKELLNYKISVTHATVVVFVWVMTAIMAQFDLYQPIPWENIALVIVVIMVVLLSKQLDQQQQKLIALHRDRIQVDPELDALMRKMAWTVEQYKKFFDKAQHIRATVRAMPDDEKEALKEDLIEAAREMTREKQEDIEPW